MVDLDNENAHLINNQNAENQDNNDQNEAQNELKDIIEKQLKTYKEALKKAAREDEVAEAGNSSRAESAAEVSTDAAEENNKFTDPIEEFCSIYGDLITNNASFDEVTRVWKIFCIVDQEYFWREYDENVWKYVDNVAFVTNFGEIGVDSELNGTYHWNILKLFSFLMHDWFNWEPGKTYALPTKMILIDNHWKHDIFKVLLEISDKFATYRNVVVHIFYQYFYEMDRFESPLRDENGYNYKYMNRTMNHVLNVADYETKTSCLTVVIPFLYLSGTEGVKEGNRKRINDHLGAKIDDLKREAASGAGNKIKITEEIRALQETKDFCELCYLIANQESSMSQFQEEFDTFLKNSKQCYGDYFATAMNRHVQLLHLMAKQEELHSLTDLIFRKFPDIAINSSIMSYFENVRHFASFKCEEFASKELEAIVST